MNGPLEPSMGLMYLLGGPGVDLTKLSSRTIPMSLVNPEDMETI